METKTNSEEATMSVSRSGRVRKKSSKLLDFQSPDEVEKALLKRSTPRPVRSTAGHGRVGRPPLNRTSESITSIPADEFEEPEGANQTITDDEDIVDNDDNELDEMVADMVEDVEAEALDNEHESKVRQSLYMSEKSNKRKILKDGKIITSKIERKDKGKSRYTAYSLWAREFRKTSKFSKNQDLDFSNASRRLSELWANVSNKEKSAWRRKAKIQASKAKANDRAEAINASQLQSPTQSTTFVNRATTSRTRKLAAERQKTPPAPPIPSPTRKRYGSLRSSTSTSTTTSNLSFLNSNYLSNTPQSTDSSPQKTQLSSTEPIDAAAHLKLLGESLFIIGERLKDHEGQIALSGSLSVLLDSILCSVGSLMCLTSFIPGLEKKAHLKANLSSTLDNIAYVMPGL